MQFQSKIQTMHCVMPSGELLIGASTRERLKAAIDQAKSGRGRGFDLPRGYDLAFHKKPRDVHESQHDIATFGVVRAFSITLNWTDALTLNADIETRDEKAAANINQMLTAMVESLRKQASQQSQPAAAIADSIRSSVSGLRLRISGAIPASHLASLSLPAAPGVPAGR